MIKNLMWFIGAIIVVNFINGMVSAAILADAEVEKNDELRRLAKWSIFLNLVVCLSSIISLIAVAYFSKTN